LRTVKSGADSSETDSADEAHDVDRSPAHRQVVKKRHVSVKRPRKPSATSTAAAQNQAFTSHFLDFRTKHTSVEMLMSSIACVCYVNDFTDVFSCCVCILVLT